jgi:diguanylate cyclase (GGDEF)-like protein/PAS domain S-box-containing protein
MVQPEAAAGTARSADEEILDRATLDTALDWLLRQPSSPQAMAMNENGLAVAMPSDVPIRTENVLTGYGSVLELCLPADLPNIVEAWERARRTGGAQVAVHLRVAPAIPVVLHFVDARYRYGVYLAFIAGNRNHVSGPENAPSLFRPRWCTWQRDELAVITEIDEATTAILGWERSDLIGKRTLELVHPDDRPLAIANWMQMLARPGFHPRAPFRYRARDGRYVWLESTHDNRLANPQSKHVVSQMLDVSERMDAIEALRENERLLRRLTEALPIGIVQIDAARRIVHANERIDGITGVAGAVTIDEHFAFAAAPDRAAFDAALRLLLERGIGSEVEVTFASPHDRRCSVSLLALAGDDGTITGAIACLADITEKVRLREELEARATFDQLTRCYNRQAILERLTLVLPSAGGVCGGIAVLFVDLDGFKEINDRLGHAAGDALLGIVGERLGGNARAGDIVGRLGGDEFLVICHNVDTPQHALDIARRTSAAIALPTVLGAESIVPGASIGVVWTDRPLDSDAIVARADAAMYESKRRAAGPVLHALKASA